MIMKYENMKKLKELKENIHGGLYPIAGQTEWYEATKVLSTSGCDLIKSIEDFRAKVHSVKIALFFPLSWNNMSYLDTNYYELLKNYELYFDVNMEFQKTIIDGDVYTDKQGYEKKYVSELLDHVGKAIDHVSSLVSAKSTEYKHCQVLFVALVAIVIAVISLIWR